MLPPRSRRRLHAALVVVCVFVASTGTGTGTSTAHALPPAARAPTIELGWRWALSPVSDDGVRLLDSLELASLVPIAGSFALVPSLDYGVSYGSPWYALYGFGLEAAYAPGTRDAAQLAPGARRILPRASFGLAGAFESVVREGSEVKRASRRGDLMLVARLGVDFVRARRLFGIDLRLAVAPGDHLAIAGPLDVGLTFRGGFVVRRATRR